ncbi:hypothetical protein [uncultured Campylobacter sp.]|uniref:hypothetical protein n=1 Tax=uncultured Campylobacter sp. TaxID=218934 RepID=UPI0028EA7E22|nr:hypothetical protein [uncultured Campylobacter sp.]
MSAKDALVLERRLEEEARDKYYETYGQKFKTKHCFLELVVNLKKHHTLKDLKKVAKYVEEKFGYRATLITLHRDEGHYEYDEQGNATKFVANIHGHIRFCVLDPENGKSIYRQKFRKKFEFKQLQTQVANILGLQRGTPNPNRKNIPSRIYKRLVKDPEALAIMTASVPEATKKVVEKLTLAKLKTINQEVREALRSMSATRKEYAQLEDILSAVKDKLKLKEKLTVENLEEQISAFLDAVKSDFSKSAVETIGGLNLKPAPDGVVRPHGKIEIAKLNGTYNILTAAAMQMNIAMAYGLNMRVEELEKMQQKRRKTAVLLSKTRSELRESQDRVQNLLEECQKYKNKLIDLQDEYDKLEEKHYAAFDAQIVKNPKKDPTVDTVEYVLPLQNKKDPTRDDWGR